ncbi:hypothetical protein J2W42_002034 [Rhizobium tibeticum]|uniref:Uncharacterized protein n=1 Tax=Rhizobium tibeticum TaxID=501024 RepID=A0ABY1AMT2_9HYPH|nr:hypothetical protein [Rhizobium tibeticum]SEO16812.1 hypothetical protein SAMN05216228_1012183 [Rhizobium tibeticum]
MKATAGISMLIQALDFYTEAATARAAFAIAAHEAGLHILPDDGEKMQKKPRRARGFRNDEQRPRAGDGGKYASWRAGSR